MSFLYDYGYSFFDSTCTPKAKLVNHEDFDDIKKIKPWIMLVIIKRGENVNHAGI